MKINNSKLKIKHSKFSLFRQWLLKLLANEKVESAKESEADMECIDAEMVETQEAHEADIVPYDENLMERSRTQWQFGDWESLSKLERQSVQHHPERAKLILLAASAHAQLGDDAKAREFTKLSLEWGCSKKLVSQIMISGVYNSLGKSTIMLGDEQKAKQNFKNAIDGAVGDLALIAQARASQEKSLIQNRFYVIKQEILLVQEKTAKENYLNHVDIKNPFLPGINSYAQNFEDVMLYRALRNVQNGFYVDIGAQHPVFDSVSKAFYEQGWCGINVEPVPKYAKLLQQDRPRDTTMEVLLSSEVGEKILYIIPETGLSTGCKEIAQKHKANGFEIEEITREQVTLDDVFKNAMGREIHWMKVDVEGMEKDVLAGWKDNASRPWIVVVESTLPNSQVTSYMEWESFLTNRDYSFVYFDGLSRFYVHKIYEQLKEFFQTPPNVFDGYKIMKYIKE